MPDDKPDPSQPAAPTGTPGMVAWFLRFFAGMTAEKLLVLILLCGVCWQGWVNREDQQAVVKQATEDRIDAKRDAEAREEKYRDHNLATIKLCNTACADQSRLRDAKTEVHMKEAMQAIDRLNATQNDLRLELVSLRTSIDKLGKKSIP